MPGSRNHDELSSTLLRAWRPRKRAISSPGRQHGPDARSEPCGGRPDDLVCLDGLGEPLACMQREAGRYRDPITFTVSRVVSMVPGLASCSWRGQVDRLPHCAKGDLEVTPDGADDDSPELRPMRI